jgi:hypothetical protein
MPHQTASVNGSIGPALVNRPLAGIIDTIGILAQSGLP